MRRSVSHDGAHLVEQVTAVADFVFPRYGHIDSALPRMDNRTCTRVDLRHSILKNTRSTIACVLLLFLRVSTSNIEERSGPRNYDRDNTRMVVSNENVSDSSTIEADYWEMKNQRGVSRNQILRFRKIGNKGETV
jgi:tRNA nucleotidyltransferase (CCA-adding enzyme)